MEFRDLKKQYEVLKNEIDTGINKILCQCNFISGSEVAELEEALAAYVGSEHCITCGNGTDALTLAMMAWEIGSGDAVFVPDFTFFASGETAALLGAEPVFVDVDPDTFNISPSALKRAVEHVLQEGRLRPRVIIAVDLFGLPAAYPELRKIADEYGLLILEDGAQGFGGEISGRLACSFGDISTTSFFPAKPLGCYGDGGAIFTNDSRIAAYLRSVRVHGKGSDKYDNVRLGMNSRLDTLQAAILMPKLKAFVSSEKASVNRAARLYAEALSGFVKVPVVPEQYVSSWAQYSICLPEESVRDGLRDYLRKNGIPSMVYYPKPMHKQQAFAAYMQDEALFPTTNRLCKTVLSLPMHPYLTEEEISFVTEKIQTYMK